MILIGSLMIATNQQKSIFLQNEISKSGLPLLHELKSMYKITPLINFIIVGGGLKCFTFPEDLTPFQRLKNRIKTTTTRHKLRSQRGRPRSWIPRLSWRWRTPRLQKHNTQTSGNHAQMCFKQTFQDGEFNFEKERKNASALF